MHSSRASSPTLRFREGKAIDVPAMERCRANDGDAGPADRRMAAYLDGQHHPQHALAPRMAVVALAEEQVIGYIAGHATTRHGCSGEVQYLYVAPDYRRSGVARRLLASLADWFCIRDIHRVCVNADAGAVPFYVALGARPLNEHWYVWEEIAFLVRKSD